MKWSLIETIALEKYGWSIYSDNYASKVTDQFRSSGLTKLEDDTVEYSSHYPVNVDMDDSSYDTKWVKEIYESLDSFLSHKKPLISKSEIK